MNSTEENLSAEQSLDLITSMIRRAQGKVSGNSFHFILWGWCITLANFGMYSLYKFTDYPYPYMVWLITIPAWVGSMWYGYKHGKEERMHSHLDSINMWLWIGMGVAMLPVCLFGYKINWVINPIVLLMAAIPTFVSGIIIRFKPLLLGGICFWIGGVLCFLTSPLNQYLVGGVTIIFGYLVPGYLLKNLKEQ